MLFASVGRHIYSVGQHLALKEVILILLWVVHVVCGIYVKCGKKKVIAPGAGKKKSGGQQNRKPLEEKNWGLNCLPPPEEKIRVLKNYFQPPNLYGVFLVYK